VAPKSVANLSDCLHLDIQSHLDISKFRGPLAKLRNIHV